MKSKYKLLGIIWLTYIVETMNTLNWHGDSEITILHVGIFVVIFFISLSVIGGKE